MHACDDQAGLVVLKTGSQSSAGLSALVRAGCSACMHARVSACSSKEHQGQAAGGDPQLGLRSTQA